MTPEAKAREKIDTKLIKSGWVIQDMCQIYVLFIDGSPVGVLTRFTDLDTAGFRFF